jgi:poly-beta-1,6-N-acetyl-D-glucosamine synthase
VTAADYSVVTPVRDEQENLARLAESLAAQTVQPIEWVIVDNGSADATVDIARALERSHPWARLLTIEPLAATPTRGGPIARALEAGLSALAAIPSFVVKLDADVTMPIDYFENLLRVFATETALGIASGVAYELDSDGAWAARQIAPGTAWGASRIYRRECLAVIRPFEESMGWDGIDQLKAERAGWTTRTIDVPFRHHRREGERDGPRTSAGWATQGRGSHYMGYRPWWLILRALSHARRDPRAVAMITGYFDAAVRRAPVCPDQGVRELLREQQSLRRLVRDRFLSGA